MTQDFIIKCFTTVLCKNKTMSSINCVLLLCGRSHREQSCAFPCHSFFFTRLVLASGLHLWKTYIGLVPSTALLPARLCSPSTSHSLCPPHGLLFTSMFCYYNTWSAHTRTHTQAVKSLLLDISWEKWLNVWNGYEQAKFTAALPLGLKPDMKRHTLPQESEDWGNLFRQSQRPLYLQPRKGKSVGNGGECHCGNLCVGL